MTNAEDVTDVKEFMSILTDVKVSVAEMNGKMDRVMDTATDTKESVAKLEVTVNEVKKTAETADHRSRENEKDINDIQKNNRQITIALITVIGAFVFQLIFFLLTFNF